MDELKKYCENHFKGGCKFRLSDDSLLIFLGGFYLQFETMLKINELKPILMIQQGQGMVNLMFTIQGRLPLEPATKEIHITKEEDLYSEKFINN